MGKSGAVTFALAGICVVLVCVLASLRSFAADSRPEPLDRVGDSQWRPGIGLVSGPVSGEAAKEKGSETVGQAEGQPPSMQVPPLRSTDVGYCPAVGVPLVAASQWNGAWGPVGGVRLRCEWRDTTSLLAPWGRFSIWIGGYPDPELIVAEGEFRAGLDIHPMRWQWLGVGILAGYRLDVLVPVGDSGGDMIIPHGLDLGGHVIFRTPESPGSPPLFFADLGVVERLTMSDDGDGTFAEVMLGIGGDYRLFVFSDVELVGDHPDTVRAGLGGGGYW